MRWLDIYWNAPLRNCIVGQHNKSRAAVILTQHGEAIDRNWTVTVMACQTALQICQHRLLAVSRECHGECHVESEIPEDVGISPALDMLDLPPREIGRQAPAAVGAGQGCAEAVEMLYARRRKPVEPGTGGCRHDRDEPLQQTDGRFKGG